MKHVCEYCNYVNDRLENYLKHIKTDKHKLKMEVIKKEEDNNKNLLLVADKITKLEDTIVKDVNEVKKVVSKVKNNTDKNHKETTKQIEEVKKIANKNKEYAKSTLTILNEFYKDNPPLEYPGDRKCLSALQEFYKISVNQVINTNKLHKAIVRDYTNRTLVDSIIKILTSFLKKDNLHLQSIFNTDISRHNYTAKHKDSWEKDKKGIYLNDIVIKPFCIIAQELKHFLIICMKKMWPIIVY